jgi:hypothetical protein
MAGKYHRRHPEHTVSYRVFFYYFERQSHVWLCPHPVPGLWGRTAAAFLIYSRDESILSLLILMPSVMWAAYRFFDFGFLDAIVLFQ